MNENESQNTNTNQMNILSTHHQAVLQRITHIKYDYLYDGPQHYVDIVEDIVGDRLVETRIRTPHGSDITDLIPYAMKKELKDAVTAHYRK